MWHTTKIFLLILFFLSLNVFSSFSQIQVNPDQTAEILAQKLAGQGITIINPFLNCPEKASGTFNTINSNLGLDSGIVLTTGRAKTEGINYGINGLSSWLASNNNNAPGDPDLNTLARGTTLDACILEFNVIANSNSLNFKYIFSSEEYINSVCGPYNDAFAFFISGPGIATYDNLAIVPGTNIPVTINSINNGVPGRLGSMSNCSAMGPGSPFTSYYIDNSSGQSLTHQGFTQVLQASHSVIPCASYHLKITIADAGDGLYDSGVFLAAGSLSSVNYTVNAIPQPTPDTSFPYCIKGCLPGKFIVKRSIPQSQSQTIKYTTSGTATAGLDYIALIDSVLIPAYDSQAIITVTGLPTAINGPKTLNITLFAPYSCNGAANRIDSASMVIYDSVYVTILTPDTVICANDSVQLRIDGSDIYTYNWLPPTSINNTNIKNPIVYPSQNTTYYVNVSVPGTSCPLKIKNIKISTKLTPTVNIATDTSVCFNSNLQLFATTTQNNLYYSYLWIGPNGFNSTLEYPLLNHVNALSKGIYTFYTKIDTNGCIGKGSINVNINITDTPQVVNPTIFCIGDGNKTITAIGDNLLWYQTVNDTTTITEPIIETNAIAQYEYFVSQRKDVCESPKSEIVVEVKKCCDGVIFIPTAFTPNNDGRNDKFEVLDHYGYFIKSFLVFNRWGQLVYNLPDGVWDGRFGGANAEVGVYSYLITLGCIRGGEVVKKGEVTLIR